MAALLGLAMLVSVGADVSGLGDAPPETVEVAEAPQPECGMPICGPLGQRLFCIEGYESRHFGGAVNPFSGARGWLQWLPATARQWGVRIGDRQSEWSAAAQIASLGERFFQSQWVPLQRGLC